MQDVFRQFIVFCGVGVVNTAFGLGTTLLLSEGLKVDYRAANAMGYAVGLCVAFVLHRSFTFARTGRGKSAHRQIGPFLAVFAVAYLSQLALLWLLVEKGHVPNIPAQVLACGFYTVIGYAGNRVLTFRA